MEELGQRAAEAPALAASLDELRRLHNDKSDELDALVDQVIDDAVQALQTDLGALGRQVDQQLEQGDLLALRHLAETDGRSLHARLLEVGEALDGAGLEQHRYKWHPRQRELARNLAIIRNKLDRRLLEKQARREKRYLDKLDAFGAWLDVVGTLPRVRISPFGCRSSRSWTTHSPRKTLSLTRGTRSCWRSRSCATSARRWPTSWRRSRSRTRGRVRRPSATHSATTP